MELTEYKKVIKVIVQQVEKKLAAREPMDGELRDIHDMLYGMQFDHDYSQDEELLSYVLKVSNYAHKVAGHMAYTTGEAAYDAAYWKLLLLEAPYQFESFLLYMERNRADKKKFYVPRMKTLKTVVDELQALEDGKYDFLGISLPPRVGKLLSDDTPVLTTDGWKNHGDLMVGDGVFGRDGEVKRVLHVFPKHFANRRVHFSDGTFIDCHENHEWVVYDRHKLKEHVVTTKYLESAVLETGEAGKRGHRYYYQIPICAPINGFESSLPVAPYALGAWLGDGRNSHPDVCCDPKDRAVVESIIADGYKVSWQSTHKTTGVEYYGFNGLREGLQQLGMCYSRKRVDKYIPDQYLCASKRQRLELLAGLLDTDGSLTVKERRYHFSTAEESLRDSMIALVSTFGWRCNVCKHEPRLSSSGIQGKKPVWVVAFNPTEYIPCRLSRKQLREFSKPRKFAITKVEEIAPNRGNCIEVEGGVYRVGERCVPTHNSTLCLFFLAWVMGKRPNSHNAMSGHSGILADGFYSEMLNLIDSKEYTFHQIFPTSELQRKSAEKKEINLCDPDRFATLTCRGIDGTWTGAVDISSDGYLYVDDLVRDRTESLSPIRLENRYQDYLNVLVDRKNDGARELMVGTRWNVLDPLGRVETEKIKNPRYKFVKIPALNKFYESNFNYKYGKGFSTSYYKNLKERLDANEWEAKYQQKPFVREGLLFPPDELRYYNGVLPEGDSRVVAACDVAWGGGDSLSMPVGREYENGEVYIFDWIFNGGKKEETLPLVVGRIMDNEIRQVRFEGNTGGELYGKYVNERLLEHGYKCSCTDKKAPARLAKMEKIIAYSGEIKRKFIFLDEDHWTAEYRAAMEELCMTVTIGKNAHDDAADGLTQLAMFLDNDGLVKTSIIRSPF